MLVKKHDIIAIFRCLNELSELSGNIKFAYGIAKNRNILKAEVENLQNAFDQKRKVLVESFAEKDENDQPKTFTGENGMQEYVIPEHAKELLNVEYQNLMTQYNEILTEEVDLEFYNIQMENFPDGIKPFQVELLIDKIII